MRRFSVRPRRAGAIRLLVLAGLSVLALTLTSEQPRRGQSQPADGQLRDFDSRGKVAPTKAQLKAARSIHGRVAGTRLERRPRHPLRRLSRGRAQGTVCRVGRAHLARRAQGGLRAALGQAPGVADRRATSRKQGPRRRLPPDLRRRPLDGRGSDRQRRSAHAAWNVVFVSSSTLTPATRLSGKPTLTPVPAWAKAAQAAGHPISQVTPLREARERLDAGGRRPGSTAPRPVRPPRSAPPRIGALRAYDTTVTKTNRRRAAASYRVIVDAATGKFLYRHNLVDQPRGRPGPVGLPDRSAVQHIERVPVELPEHRHAADRCSTATGGCTYVVWKTRRRRCTRWASPRSSRGTCRWTTRPSRARRRARSATTSTRRSCGAAAAGHTTTRRIRGRSAPTRDYTAANFPFTNQWFNSGCDPAPLTATAQAGAQANPNVEDWSAATINLFVGHNRHARLLVLPRLGRGSLERPAVQQGRNDGRPVAVAGRACGHAGR